MKKTLILSLIALAPCAVAADFRSISYGDDCFDLEAKEKSLGGVPERIEMSPYIFRADYNGHPARVSYMCSDNGFLSGHYSFERTTFEVARVMYLEIKQHLTRELGAPLYDGGSEEYREQVSRAGLRLSEADRYSAIWISGQSEISISIYGSSKSTQQSHVYVIYKQREEI